MQEYLIARKTIVLIVDCTFSQILRTLFYNFHSPRQNNFVGHIHSANYNEPRFLAAELSVPQVYYIRGLQSVKLIDRSITYAYSLLTWPFSSPRQ